MPLTILSIGTEVPTHSISQAQAAQIAKPLCARTEKEAGLLDVLYRRTRIQERSSVLLLENNETTPQHPFFSSQTRSQGPTTGKRMEYYAEAALPLALGAAQAALAEARTSPTQITHLITVSCTGFQAPGVDIGLIKKLGLASTVSRTHIGFMGCHGAFNGLKVAQALADSHPNARILLVAVELCSLHFHFGWDPEKIVANGLFADGAAALVAQANTLIQTSPSVILSGNEGSLDSSAPQSNPLGSPQNDKTTREDKGEENLKLLNSGSYLFPDSEDAMTWKIGDHGFEMTLSARVPALIELHLRGWLEKWLGEKGLGLNDIASWAIHPGGPRILDTVRKSLGLTPETTRFSEEILRDHGNMSSPTVLFILERLRKARIAGACVALGFGPGLTAEAALFT